MVKGTSGYTDPMSIIKKTVLTRKSDMWSLGIAMLTVATPYTHIEDLSTKSLKTRSASTADEFIKEIVETLVPDRTSAINQAVYTLLTADETQTCKTVLLSILDNVQKNH